MKLIAFTIVGLYTLALAYVTFYCLLQFHLLLQYKKARKNRSTTNLLPESATATLPHVTIQLPLYNELYVVERLIDNIVKLHYPKEKLEIQILDDSIDETSKLCLYKVNQYKEQGFNIHYIHRTKREGYKAGALSEGLSVAKGEFIA
ncbi:MAG: glycosyltransferase, partial [Saprospiraceae bacterium]